MVCSITFPFLHFPPEEQISFMEEPVSCKEKIKNKDIVGKCIPPKCTERPLVINGRSQITGFYHMPLKIFCLGNSEKFCRGAT